MVWGLHGSGDSDVQRGVQADNVNGLIPDGQFPRIGGQVALSLFTKNQPSNITAIEPLQIEGYCVTGVW